MRLQRQPEKQIYRSAKIMTDLEKLSRYSRLRDLLDTAQQIGIAASVWDKAASARYIEEIFSCYRPLKTWGASANWRGTFAQPSGTLPI